MVFSWKYITEHLLRLTSHLVKRFLYKSTKSPPQANSSKFSASSAHNSINTVKLLEAVLVFTETPIRLFFHFTFFRFISFKQENLFSVSLKKFSIWKYFTLSRSTGWPGEARREGRREGMIIHRLVIELKLRHKGVKERNHVPVPTRNSLSNI